MSELTFPDPEEQKRDGSARQGSPWERDRSLDPGRSEDAESAFARIVAGLRAEPDGLRWPAVDADEDHFEPPEPPPLPVPRPRTVGGVLGLAVGVLLLAEPNLLGVGERVATPLGLFALTAGIGWLMIGLRSGPPPEGSDDGAQL